MQRVESESRLSKCETETCWGDQEKKKEWVKGRERRCDENMSYHVSYLVFCVPFPVF